MEYQIERVNLRDHRTLKQKFNMTTWTIEYDEPMRGEMGEDALEELTQMFIKYIEESK